MTKAIKEYKRASDSDCYIQAFLFIRKVVIGPWGDNRLNAACAATKVNDHCTIVSQYLQFLPLNIRFNLRLRKDKDEKTFLW